MAETDRISSWTLQDHSTCAITFWICKMTPIPWHESSSTVKLNERSWWWIFLTKKYLALRCACQLGVIDTTLDVSESRRGRLMGSLSAL